MIVAEPVSAALELLLVKMFDGSFGAYGGASAGAEFPVYATFSGAAGSAFGYSSNDRTLCTFPSSVS